MLNPPTASPSYSRGRLLKAGITPAQRLRRKRKSIKRTMRRHQRLLNTAISPGAVFVARLGWIPPHLSNPYSRQEIRNHLLECNSTFYHSAWARPADYLSVINGPVVNDLRVPRLLRALKPTDQPSALETTGLMKLQSGHLFCITEFLKWNYQGFRRFMFKVLEEMSIERCGGEWALLYPYEMEVSFPTVDFRKRDYRKFYLVQIVRDDTQQLKELRFYSSTYAPVLRMEIALKENEVVPENCREWWSTRDLPLPIDWVNIIEPKGDPLA